MSFEFITNENTYGTAADATTVTGLHLGGIFKGQTRKETFQIGNIGAGDTTFNVVVSGVESDITENVELSKDGNDWSESVHISGIKPNAVTDLIHVKYTPDADDYTCAGTFLLQVTED